MCGIFGFATPQSSTFAGPKLARLTRALTLASESRGKEASGFCLNYAGLTVVKDAVSGSRLIRTPQYRAQIESPINRRQRPSFMALLGHTRLATDGASDDNRNNQPVVTRDSVGVHNGIICNTEALASANAQISWESDLDSELLFKLFEQELAHGHSAVEAMQKTLGVSEGTASIACFYDGGKRLVLATNCGSIYATVSEDLVAYASERQFLEKALRTSGMDERVASIQQVEPLQMLEIDLEKFTILTHRFDRAASAPSTSAPCIDAAPRIGSGDYIDSAEHSRKVAQWTTAIESLRRCTKCVLPETHPYIEFDAAGVCSFCRSYRPVTRKPLAQLTERLAPKPGKIGRGSNCLVALSGGRDSCFVLHHLKEVMGLNPVAYSYDWGLVTDLARRNQARMCGALGIEHIIISADLAKKRRNVRLNVAAWLRRPHLGTIPLFMAGDKMFFTHANSLAKRLGTDAIVFGMNELESNDFKEGFCGINRVKTEEKFYDLNAMQKAKMIAFYGKEFGLNPAFWNVSLLDTMKAFGAYYLVPHDYVLFFSYNAWNEREIETTLIDRYNWEVSPDTKTTWRIGDGTAAFYNYIYYTVAGFSESEPFRSNQVREGQLTRERALEICREENRPRYESLRWYMETIDLDVNDAIRRVDQMPRLF